MASPDGTGLPYPPDAAPRLEHALWAASLGLRVHPLHHIQSDGLTCSCQTRGGEVDPATLEPVYCRHGNRMAGKHPRLAAWPERASNEPVAVRALFTQSASRQKSNIAVATGPGSGVFVVDVDPAHGGDESLALLIAHYGPLPDTWETLTASGGRHLWYAWPELPDFITIGNVTAGPTGGPLGPGLDVRGEGGYVVIPPSDRGILGVYCWELSSIPGEVPLAPAPEWLVELLTRPARLPFSSRQPEQGYPPADLEAIEAGCAFMRRCRDEAPSLTQWEWRQALSIWGRCQDGEALAHERSGLDPARYTPEATRQALQAALQRSGPVRCAYVETQLNHAGCLICPHHGRLASPIQLGRQTPETRPFAQREVPPPGVGEIPMGGRDSRSPSLSSPPVPEPSPAPAPGAEKAPQEPPEDGAPHPAETPPPETRQRRRAQKQAEHKRRTPVVLTARELLAKVFPEPRDVLPQIVPEGLTLLVGRSKLGKSILMMQGAVAVASGGPLFGRPCDLPPGRALYMDLENGERRARQRVDDLLAVTGEDDARQDRLHVATFWNGWQEGGLEYLEAWMAKYSDTRLIVIDTLKRVRPGETGNKRLYDLDYEALSPLADLAHRFNMAVVVIHHTRKADASDVLDMASGSTGLVAAVDTVLIWRRRRGFPEAKLYVADRDRGEVQHQFIWNAQLKGWGWAGTQAAEAEGDGEGSGTESPGDTRAAVLKTLEETAEPLSPAELAAHLRKSTNAMRVQLFRMAKAGDVRHLDIRPTPSGAERGSFYSPVEPKAADKAAAKTDDSHSACNGVMPSLFDPLYQEETGAETGITSLAITSNVMPGHVMPQNGPLPDTEDPKTGEALHITSELTVSTAGYVAAGALNRHRAEEAVLALAAWRQWGGFTSARGGFGFPEGVADREPTEQEREAAWRRDVAQVSDAGLASVWVSLWSRNPPAALSQWAPPVGQGARV